MNFFKILVVAVLSAYLIISINMVSAQTNNSTETTMILKTGSVTGTEYKNGTYIQTVDFEGNVGTIQIEKSIFIKIFKNDSLYKTDLITTDNTTSDKLFYYPITVMGKSGLDVYDIYFTYGNQTVKETLPITHTGIKPTPNSPLQQFKMGVPALNIKCMQGFQLIIKSEDGSPACVTLNTADILVERGWGHLL